MREEESERRLNKIKMKRGNEYSQVREIGEEREQTQNNKRQGEEKMTKS